MNSLKSCLILVFLFFATTSFAQRETAVGIVWLELLPHDFHEMEYDEFVSHFTELSSKDEKIQFIEDEFLSGERRIHCIRFIDRRMAETFLISFDGGKSLWRSMSIKLQNTRDIRRFDPNFRFFFMGKNSTTGKGKTGKVRSKLKWAAYFASIVEQFHLEYLGSTNRNFSITDENLDGEWCSTRIRLNNISRDVIIVSSFRDSFTQKRRNYVSIVIDNE